MSEDLYQLARDVPLVPDRVMLELANSVVVAADLTRFRQDQGVISGLLARIVGKERRRELLTTRALLDGRQALIGWVTELSGHVQVSDLALSRVANSLVETRRRAAADTARLSTQVTELAEVVARMAEVCEARLTRVEDRMSELEHRQAMTELRLEADESFALSTGRWASGHTYARVPWPLQVVLLAAEVAHGPAGLHSHLTEGRTFDERLVNKIMSTPSDAPEGSFVVTDLLDEACGSLAENELQLVAELLGSGLDTSLAAPGGPLVSVIGSAVELWALPQGARPAAPAKTALALVQRRHGMWTPRTSSARRFVEHVVAEQTAAARTLRRRLTPTGPQPDGEPGGEQLTVPDAAPAGELLS
ncbi:hypothetical protein [Streptomyces koelreuteriae]|uniref:hypothetical protein n=1 Tax=Streptomyces koelreuteriae TaxID=2838015 RepID=UPI003EB71906